MDVVYYKMYFITCILMHMQAQISASLITLSGTTATITTTNNHGLTTSNVVAITVAGADQAGYNGTFKGAVTGANTITYTTTAGLASPATTLLAGGITLSYAFLFYVTGTNQLVRAEVTDSTSGAQFSESITDIAGTSMSLFGLGLANDRITFNRYNGELFIGSGRYICKIGTDGVVVPAAFVLPNGWRAISLAPYAHNMAILAGSVIPGNNYSKVFYWDLENTSGFIDESVITTGGPQIIVNFNESLWAICAINNILQVYKMSDKLPVQMQRLVNIATETATQAIIPDATKFVKDNAFYFGLWKTDKTGLYAIGQVDSGKPYGLVLAKRFHFPTISSIVRGGTGNLTATVTTSTAHGLTTGDDIIVTGATNPIYNGTFRVVSGSNVTLIYTLPSDPGANETTAPSITSKSYSLHKPYAAISIGENWYSSFDNNGTASVAKGEGASQVRSSQAVYETIWIDGNSPETPKSWDGFLIGTKIVPANCQIVVDTKVDNASTYDSNSVYSLTPSNDQSDDGITGDTFWFRDWTSVYGRMGKIRLRFISSTTTKATVYFLSFLSRLGVTF